MKFQATAHVPPDVRHDFKTTPHAEIADLLSTSNSQVEVGIEVYESTGRGQYHLLLAVETVSPTSFLGYEDVYPQTEHFPPEIKDDQKKIAEHLIRSCIRGLWKELRRGNAVDEHTEDILVMYQSLASGFSSVESNGNEIQVPEFNLNSKALDKTGQVYDIDDRSLHGQTSWWIANRIAGVQLEHRTLNGLEMNGCNGIALGERVQ
ncbi:hypothetical protein ANO14919_082350 [Xylariales sp. No.14919]|nr:hypothetical protein ANO14919_082350 [Xylariales sp. No.14919]